MHLSKKVCTFVHNLFLLAGLIVLFIAILCTELMTVMGIGAMGMALIGLAYGFVALFWRCPFCGRRLPWKEGKHRFLPAPTAAKN